MRPSCFSIVASLAVTASAFPANIDLAAAGFSSDALPDRRDLISYFNAEAQYIDTTGEHSWVAPTTEDARGPCPGLNAMANHGYLPHNGVGTITDFVLGTFKVFGMSLDLGAFLAVLGASFDGDGTSWSIGGPHPAVGLGATGLIGSHNKYESDVSPCRPDLYEAGNNYEVVLSQWQELYDLQKDVPNEDSNYSLELLREFRSRRFDQQIANNPYFFNGPFTGVAVQPAAYTFIYRFMGNKSAEHPDGQLTKEVLKSFFGMTENADGSWSGGRGYERIPDNWYKRAIGDEYSIPFFQTDFLKDALVHPKFLDIGGNTGKVNTFTGVDLGDLSGGVFNVKTLAEGNNAFCLASQFAAQAEPDLLRTLLSTLGGEAGKALLGLGCPLLTRFDDDQLKAFPGYSRSLEEK
ncbi:Cloroperoxidase [Pseudovirgaria hyperparasitica]|uniref:Cloroperoxidase n=1 Tax=Pseudovirgaria hyperparasitica TaxID=470096 RepID=A0A6A6W9Q1_9PEZI|nr:Cloroperoxidase [Pseudovirgaria hyperparasitica]KAF2758606.1 Cloroperoxidase [Pseudovirgaria hyperparasitica]